jgi:hypothetical protein
MEKDALILEAVRQAIAKYKHAITTTELQSIQFTVRFMNDGRQMIRTTKVNIEGEEMPLRAAGSWGPPK